MAASKIVRDGKIVYLSQLKQCDKCTNKCSRRCKLCIKCARRTGHKKISPKIYAKIIEMLRKGIKTRLIQNETNVSHMTINKIKKEMVYV